MLILAKYLFKFNTFIPKKHVARHKFPSNVKQTMFLSAPMVTSCIVYSPHLTPRLRYAFDFLLSRSLNLSVRYTDQLADVDQGDQLTINYDQQHRNWATINLPASGWLWQSGIQPINPGVGHYGDLITLFPVSDRTFSIPFDLPAALFYLLSRYEEYLPFTADYHGRFPAKASIAYQQGFLQRPVVNEWVLFFRKVAQQQGVTVSACPLAYRFLPTYDVDLAWAYRHRPLWWQLATLARDSFRWDWSTWSERWSVLSRQQNDPYDTYDWLDGLHQKHQLKARYFWLLSTSGRYDRGFSVSSPPFRQLFRRHQSRYSCGIHPSYRSNQDATVLDEEIRRYTQLSGAPPSTSRQHFLKLTFPTTYRHLIRVGIQSDWSLGYPEQPGFRSGYGGPFLWYDLQKEETTDLVLIPFQVMDGTLYRYMNLSPDAAAEQLEALINICREHKAWLVSLWHNSSFTPGQGWVDMARVYRHFLAKASHK